MTPAAAIAAIVVSHESGATIDDCLARLRAADGVAQIRVIDNASQDGTLAIVQRHAAADARVRFIGNPDNPGFSVACNQGAAECDASWLAFVNPDCLVEADSLSRLRDLAREAAHDAGRDILLGADLVDEHGARDPAARRRDPDFAAMLGSRAARELGIAPDNALRLQGVDAISGALMLLSRALFDRLGGFDSGYRLHAEDLDLCRRARLAGAAIAVANGVRVRAPARHLQPGAAAVRRMAPASRAGALFPQVRGATARRAHAPVRLRRHLGAFSVCRAARADALTPQALVDATAAQSAATDVLNDNG